MPKLTDLINPETASAYIVERRLNSLSSELDLIIFSQAEAMSKIDVLLLDQYKKELSKEQQFTLLVLKADIAKSIDQLKDAGKKL